MNKPRVLSSYKETTFVARKEFLIDQLLWIYRAKISLLQTENCLKEDVEQRVSYSVKTTLRIRFRLTELTSFCHITYFSVHRLDPVPN